MRNFWCKYGISQHFEIYLYEVKRARVHCVTTKLRMRFSFSWWHKRSSTLSLSLSCVQRVWAIGYFSIANQCVQQKHNSKKKNEASVGDKNIERLNFITKIFIASAILGKQQHSPVFILERSYCTADNEFIVLCIEHFGAFVFIKTKHMNLSLIPLCFGVYVDLHFCLLS